MNNRVSYPFCWMVLFFLPGIILYKFLPLPFAWLFWMFIVCAAAAAVCLKTRIMFFVFFALSLTILGSILSSHYQFISSDHVLKSYRFYRGKSVDIMGDIVSPVSVSRRAYVKTSFELDVKSIHAPFGWRDAEGRLLVNVFRRADLRYGDRIVLTGRLHYPFEKDDGSPSSYKDYLRRKRIYLMFSVKKDAPVSVRAEKPFYPLRSLFGVRNTFRNILDRYLGPQECGLMKAMLLGDRTQIPSHIREIFVRTGTAHILAISGLHIGMIAALFLLLIKLFPLPRVGQFILTVMLLTVYAVLAGLRPSVIRACVIAVLLLFSYVFERETEGYHSLSIAAFILLLINPLNLFDVGFQLSFISVFSIMLLYPRLMNILKKRFAENQSGPARYLWQSLAVSLSAYLGVAGLIAYYFQIVTPVAIFANLFVVPLVAVIISLGLGLLAAGGICPPAAAAFAACLKILLNAMAALIFLFGQIPGAYFPLKAMPLWGIFLYYALFFLGVFLLVNKK